MHHRPLGHDGTQGRRLDGLVEYLDCEGARGLAHIRGAIGGYEHGRNFRSEQPPQLGDRFDAVAVVEMIVNQESARRVSPSTVGVTGTSIEKCVPRSTCEASAIG